MNEAIIIFAVVIGFYMGRFKEVNKEVKSKIVDIKDISSYKPSVLSIDEADLEREMKKDEKEKIDISDIV